jgi:hypothetical protein
MNKRRIQIKQPTIYSGWLTTAIVRIKIHKPKMLTIQQYMTKGE